MVRRRARLWLLLRLLVSLSPCLPVSFSAAADPPRRFVAPGPGGKLVYAADERGDRIPDFSHCGYGGGGVAIPDAPVRVVVPPAEGDATARIQAAIDYVSGLP